MTWRSNSAINSSNDSLPVMVMALRDDQFAPETIIFGAPLEEVVQRGDGMIPTPVRHCVEFLEKNGLDEPFIYRAVASHSFKRKVITAYDCGNEVRLHDSFHPTEVAGVLKMYFYLLPEPIFTSELVGKFRAVETIKKKSDKLQALRSLVVQLPMAHFSTLQYLIEHLKHVADHSDANKMSRVNIGVCWGPDYATIFPYMIKHFSDIFETELLNSDSRRDKRKARNFGSKGKGHKIKERDKRSLREMSNGVDDRTASKGSGKKARKNSSKKKLKGAREYGLDDNEFRSSSEVPSVINKSASVRNEKISSKHHSKKKLKSNVDDRGKSSSE